MPGMCDGPNPEGWGRFFSDGGRRGIAIFLCAVLTAQWAVPARFVRAQESPEPALLLKYAAPDIPETVSREILDPLPGLLAKEVRVRWVSVPTESAPGTEPDTAFPVPDDAALRRISGNISRASMHMERVENEEARKFLAEAEKEARSCRFTETTLPFLAEIFLRAGILKLREGDFPSGEALFSRSRALSPGFSPDPALFPPPVLAAWANASRRPIPETELLVQSLPSGAGIAVDGEYQGKTPSRVRPGKTGPVRIRVFHKGYRDAEAVGQWLPGDSETLDFTLSGDRVARLGELLADGDGKRGKGGGPLIAEFAAAAGAERIAVVVLEKDRSGEGYRARAYAGGIPGGDPAFLGEKDLPAGGRGSETAGKWFAARLIESGWPPETKDPEAKPWYKNWWTWGLLLSAAGLVALLAGGGGGSAGSEGSSIAVDF